MILMPGSFYEEIFTFNKILKNGDAGVTSMPDPNR